MSVRVLVIPEDPVNNGAILKPLAEMVLAEAGKPTAKVKVLENPRVRGYDEASRVVRNELASRYGFMDLWLFLPDADRATGDAMRDLEKSLRSQGVALFCCPAVPEVEIYACVAHRTKIGDSWEAVRANPRLKEAIFFPLLRAHGDPQRPDGGRRMLAESSMAQRSRFFRLCPEIAELRDRIAAHLAG